MQWALRSMFGHMVFFTLSVAFPLTIWLLVELDGVDALTLVNGLVMTGLSLVCGLATAYGLWRFYFKSRRLPPP